MQRVHIGTKTLQGRLERYAQRFDLLELRLDQDALLQPRTLRRWRNSVPPTFAFSVVLPPIVCSLRSSEQSDAALQAAIAAATAVEAPVLLIATPVSVTPTTVNRKRLAELVGRLNRDVIKVAWEPSGLWEDDDARAVAATLGLVLVGDPARDDLAPGPVAYARLRGLGDDRRLSGSRLDRAVERLRSFRDAFVVVESDRPTAVARALRESAAVVEPMRLRPTKMRAPAAPLRAEDEEQ
jgi:uncharacterized protein YecE (DUF72 family)